MVREYPALVITDARDLSKNSGNPAFAHPNLFPGRRKILMDFHPYGYETFIFTLGAPHEEA